MLILGIDPGLRRANPAGWAVYDSAAAEVRACGVWQPDDKQPWEERVTWVGTHLLPICALHAVSYIACEDAFHGQNLQTYRQLVAFGWEVRRRAREMSCPFVLVNPADQARTLAHIPASILEAAAAGVPQKLRTHAYSAIAIAWHSAGLFERAQLEAA